MICPYCTPDENGKRRCSLARHDFEPDCRCPECGREEPPQPSVDDLPELSDEYLDAELRFMRGEYDPWLEEENKTRVYSQANGGL